MQDMTIGAPTPQLWRYALPLVLGNWFQLAYNAVDSIIVGRFIGQDALAAEGVAAPVMNLVILGISGVTLGAGVLFSEFYGAKAFDRMRRTLATTLLFGTLAALGLAVLGWALSPVLLAALAVPPQLAQIAALYLRITFFGVPFTFVYNALAGALKSVGDAKTPLKFLTLSATLNAALDFVLIGCFGFGIACSAATTVAAQALSALLAAMYLYKNTPQLWPKPAQWRIDRPLLARTLRYGGVTALQQLAQPLGKVLIQGQVNTLGVAAIAAFNAVGRVDDFACIPAQSIAHAITTFVAQNRGAQQPQRIRAGFAAGLRLEFCYWLLIGSATALGRGALVALFVDGAGAAQVVAQGSAYLGWMALFYLLPGFTNGFQGFYRGSGMLGVTLLGTVLQISLRVLGTVVLAPRCGLVGVAWATALGWGVMLVFEVPYYFVKVTKKES